MFNVSALLLDDALVMCIVTEDVFNCCLEDTDISQGSVATNFRCGGIFSDNIITDILLILTVKYLSLKIGQYLTKLRCKKTKCAILGHPVFAVVCSVGYLPLSVYNGTLVRTGSSSGYSRSITRLHTVRMRKSPAK